MVVHVLQAALQYFCLDASQTKRCFHGLHAFVGIEGFALENIDVDMLTIRERMHADVAFGDQYES